MDLGTINPSSVVASIGGSITGLAFMPWEAMTWPKRLLTLFVGFTFAVFVSPWLLEKIYGPSVSLQTTLMVSYVSGAGAHILLPKLIKMLSGLTGEKP